MSNPFEVVHSRFSRAMAVTLAKIVVCANNDDEVWACCRVATKLSPYPISPSTFLHGRHFEEWMDAGEVIHLEALQTLAYSYLHSVGAV